jgi:hypothetical protein
MQTNALDPPSPAPEGQVHCERCDPKGEHRLEVFYRHPKTQEVICIPCERKQLKEATLRERLANI